MAIFTDSSLNIQFTRINFFKMIIFKMMVKDQGILSVSSMLDLGGSCRGRGAALIPKT